MSYVRKNIPFDLTKPNEKKLWEWLKTQPHGSFAEETKKYWTEKMSKVAPYGYKYENDQLAIEENEAKAVKLMSELLLDYNLRWNEVETILNEFKIPKKGQPWPVEFDDMTEDIYRRVNEILAEREENEQESISEPIIDEDAFQKTQEKFRKMKESDNK